MSYYDDYVNIEGFEYIGELELDNEQWAFSVVGAWVKEGALYLGTDSGCSCPTPWEYMTEDYLTGPLTYEQAVEEITSLANLEEGGYGHTDPAELAEFIEMIRL